MTNPGESDNQASVAREGLHDILGYGPLATRAINILMDHGIATSAESSRTTHIELVELPGIGQRILGHVVTSQDCCDRITKEER